ncbi:MAG: DUF1653 domain-containing protein [Bacteroidales bacterium]|nr:DUF1653 domain-containing protein [Bacteroidales bacterium]
MDTKCNDVVGFYRHFKGRYYQLVGVATHSESLEPMVIYRAMYGEGALWVRPYAMFFEMVEKDGYCGPRFTRVEQSGLPVEALTYVEY